MDTLFTPQTPVSPPAPPPVTPPAPATPRNTPVANGFARNAGASARGPAPSTPGRGNGPRPGGGPRNNGAPRSGTGPGSGSVPAKPAEPLSLWGDGWPNGSGPPSPLETTGPFPIIIPPEAPPREQSRLVIFSVGAVLILVLVVAGFSLRNFGSSDKVTPSGANSPLPTVSAAPPSPAPSTSSEPPTATSTPTPTSTVPVEVAGIRAIDPQGDGDEDTSKSPLAVDDDPSTSWKSDTYRSSTFGGLKKGVGLALKLKKTAAVQSATIEVAGSGGAVELRTSDSSDLDSSKVVGKATIKNGKVTVRADNASPSKYVILWFTKLPSVDGKYKIEVSEVQLK
jgi:hypothetical protein